MTDLITVPTFTFRQGKNSDGSFEENPIQVSFTNVESMNGDLR